MKYAKHFFHPWRTCAIIAFAITFTASSVSAEVVHKTTLEYRGKFAVQVIKKHRFIKRLNELKNALSPAAYKEIAEKALSKQFGHSRVAIQDIKFLRVLSTDEREHWIVEAGGLAWPDVKKEAPESVKVMVLLDGSVPAWLYNRR